MYGSVAVLNLSLALLLARLRPPSLAATFVLALLVTTAASALMKMLAPETTGAAIWFAFAFDAAAFVPLLAMPFVFPWRRVGPRGVRVVLAAGVLLVAESVLAVGLLSPELFRGAVDAAWLDLAFVPFGLAYKAIPALGALLFLDSFLVARDRVPREQAGLFLAAYALKVGAVSGLLLPGLLAPDFPPEGTSPGADVRAAAGALADVVALVAFAAIPLALAASRRPGGSRAGAPLHADALVLGVLALGIGLSLASAAPMEYFLLRPILVAYAILQYQFLEVEARRSRAAIGVAVLAAMGAAFMLAIQAAEAQGSAATVGVGVGFFAALLVGGAFGWPMVQLALSSASGDRRLLIYRAALEAASHEGRDAETFEALRPLRKELGISDREHAAVLAQDPEAQAEGPLRPGTVFLGRYRIARELGRGASGEVYLARDERLGREVALKRLVEHHRRDAAALERFREEMRLASALQHTNIVAIHDVETVGDDAYLVMEYVAGGNLEERLRKGAMPEPEGRRLALDLLAALGALHARGIVHRDVKPSNVLLDADGRAKLGDFTVAREAVSGETVGFTHTPGPVGTPAWMAPEQARGVAATTRSDLYAVGATLYAALSGHPPVATDGLGEFEARLRVVEDAPALPLPGVSERVNAVLARALAKDPADRYASAEEMASALA